MTITRSRLVRYFDKQPVYPKPTVPTELEKKVGARHVEDLSDFLSQVRATSFARSRFSRFRAVRYHYCELPLA